jgi:autotransporter-associated beta strand protein
MRKLLLTICLLAAFTLTVSAQRFTDKLDRGLVVVPTGSSGNSNSNFVSWRRLADEYYGVKYNVYKDGALVASNLETTNYSGSGSSTSYYQVAAVVNGVEQKKCAGVTPWYQNVLTTVRGRTVGGYITILLANVYDRDGVDVTANYEPNDAEMADLDGDGQLEIIIKRLNTVDAAAVYPQDSKQFVVLDAYDVNWQTGEATLMWRIDCGPNMVSLNSTEINIIAYDWDEDGKAEVVLRGADNMIVYGSNGKTAMYTIGVANVNTRNTFDPANGSQYAWTHTGAEYLIYMNGETGELIQQVDYPLKRLESNDSNLKTAWGDDYGHRSSKYFFGAPFLDGRKASLFLARGIYTRHKMMALNLGSDGKWDIENPVWTWNCNNSNSPWYGQGYHNYVIADVDEDGRDEIVYGSMVIDDNGKGLHTTGYGHGDAQHVGDFDPYRKGLEFFGCIEDEPYYGSDYRNATTGEVYFKKTSNDDDGRALMGNFINTYPGSIGRSASMGLWLSGVTDQEIDGTGTISDDKNDGNNHLNFRIYWDEDLCSEILDSPGKAGWGIVVKPGTGRIYGLYNSNQTDGAGLNNDSKNNPCFQGDIIGDWREEIVARYGTNIRVYTTAISSDYSMPCLWLDHQYRQAMVWQMMAYNQPPHVSYFLGEMEGITIAPPPLTMEGRTEIEKDGTIGTDLNGKQVLMCNNTSTSSSFTLAEGAQPSVIFDNTPSWTQGADNNSGIIYKENYQHVLKGAAITGSTRVTKQGNGKLKLSKSTHTYTGNTDVWGGTLECDGTLQNSPVWLNRFARLESAGGTFGAGITADYGSEIQPGGSGTISSLTTTTLTMNFGARMVLDINSNDLTADQVNVDNLVIGTKTDDVWRNYGPEYLEPVMEFQLTGSAIDATYDLGEVSTITGSLSDITIEGVENATLKHENGHLLLVVGTGISTACAEATFSQSGWQTNGEGILMPVVTVNATPFEYGSETVTPTLSATFTPQGGTPSNVSLIKTLYSEDYESATDASSWTNGAGVLELVTGNATYGKYIHHYMYDTGITANRSAYTILNGFDFNGVTAYNIEFDAYLKAGNVADRSVTDFVIMSKGAVIPTTKNIGFGYNADKCNAAGTNYLFRMTAANSQDFTINESTALTLSAAWSHFTISIDTEARKAAYSITRGTTLLASGTFSIPEGTSCEAYGLFILDGRGIGESMFDNIHIYATDPLSYAFTEPGTLTVTSSHQGCTSTDATFTCDYVGAQIGSLGWSTFGCKYPLDLSANGLTAYVISSHVNGYVKLTEVTSVPASTGLLLQGDQGIYTLPIVNDNPAAPASNLLTAVTNATGTPATAGSYVLANKASGVGFYSIQQDVVIPAGKAYLTLPANSREVIMIGEATGISEMLMNEENKAVYNLNGQRIAVPRKGIYIINGKKTVVRSAEGDAYQGK